MLNPQEFAIERAKPLAVYFLLDVSGSMGVEKIDALNEAAHDMIRSMADEVVLKQFIDGTEHELFNAGNAKQLHELLEASRYRQVGAVKLLRE